jgi:hypothetical protein
MIAFARNDVSDDAERTASDCHELPPGPDRSDAAAEMDVPSELSGKRG